MEIRAYTIIQHTVSRYKGARRPPVQLFFAVSLGANHPTADTP